MGFNLILFRNQLKNQYKLIQKSNYAKNAVKTSKLESHHKPSDIQFKWYNLWQKKLKEKNKQDDKEIFTMLFPPPNVTGNLHLGHAITATIQDVIVRWKLMNGVRVIWVPGFDHAGIATQVVVEKKLWSERKLTRYDIGKEKFIGEVLKWKDEKRDTIKNQLIKLNALVEWDYEYFTMDEDICRSVDEAFVRLYDQGIIYRAIRPINWCCSLKSAISDAEVEVVNIVKRTQLNIPSYKKPIDFGLIYKYAYPIKDSDAEIVVATTRPETMFGDTAIAVNPSDDRYKNLHGKFAINPLTNETIPIIVDEKVDSGFYNGAVKITPSHDVNDYETGTRHDLKFKQVISDDGVLINVPEEFMNLPRFNARWKVIERLKELNLWRGQNEHAMNLPTCSRTGDVIEPMMKEQWFARASQLFDICSKAVESGDLRLMPENRGLLWKNYCNVYKKDWCISRQLWWGQRIPAYRCRPEKGGGEEKWFVGRTLDEARNKAVEHFKTDKLVLEQDEDVFDTWFTSTLLPLAALGWPHDRRSPSQPLPLSRLYPMHMLETGFDIMYFWAFRMVGMCHALSSNNQKAIPFRDILFHGLIRDPEGRKMSKSVGNVIDPIDLIDGVTVKDMDDRVLNAPGMSEKEKSKALKGQRKIWPHGIEQIGSDAMRLALLVQDFKCDNVNIDPNLFRDAKRFCNKIWQAIRYFNNSTPEKKDSFKLISLNELIESNRGGLLDNWMLNELRETIKQVEYNFNNEYQFHLVVKQLREFFYGSYCDFYLEATKPLLKNDGSENLERQEFVWNLLREINRLTLILYHPFMPSITEELWQITLSHPDSSILDEKYPKYEEIPPLKDVDLNHVKAIVDNVRTLIRDVLRVKKSLKSDEIVSICNIKCTDERIEKELVGLQNEIEHLTKLEKKIKIKTKFDDIGSDDQEKTDIQWVKVSEKIEVMIKIARKE